MRPTIQRQLLKTDDQIGIQIDEKRFSSVCTATGPSRFIFRHRITARYLACAIAAETDPA